MPSLLCVPSVTVTFTYNTGLKIDEDSPGHVLASPCLTKECIEGIICLAHRLISWHHPIGLDSVFQAVELPAGIAHLAASLADVDGDHLAHFGITDVVGGRGERTLFF